MKNDQIWYLAEINIIYSCRENDTLEYIGYCDRHMLMCWNFDYAWDVFTVRSSTLLLSSSTYDTHLLSPFSVDEITITSRSSQETY